MDQSQCGLWIISRVNPIEVKTGKASLNYIEIAQGNIQSGDRVVVKGNELLQPGQTVNVLEELDYSL